MLSLALHIAFVLVVTMAWKPGMPLGVTEVELVDATLPAAEGRLEPIPVAPAVTRPSPAPEPKAPVVTAEKSPARPVPKQESKPVEAVKQVPVETTSPLDTSAEAVERVSAEEEGVVEETLAHSPPSAAPGANSDSEETPFSDASVPPATEGVSIGSAGMDIELLRLSYSARLKELIERHIKYPVFARRARLEGTCMVSCSLMCSGKVLDMEIVKSTGHELLDNAALKAVCDAGSFPPPPEGLCTGELDVKVPVTFDLTGL